MATVADLIRRSLSILGVKAAGEAASAEDLADGLETLNDMLDSWAGEHLLLFASLRSTHTLTPSLSPHTIGASGTFNTTRPVRIDRASIVSGGSETPISILTDAEWQTTQGKTTGGTPSSLWIEDAYPLMKLWFHPVPNAAASLVLYTWSQLGNFTASDQLDLPKGYRRAIRFNLAAELAPEYGVQLSAEAANIANESKATLKRLNHRGTHLKSDLAGGGFNLITGDS